MKPTQWNVAMLIAAFAMGGCERAHPGSSLEPADEKAPTVAIDTAHVVAASGTDSQSPALQPGLPVAPDATPQQVVAAFLESLRAGDDQRAAALLTDKARRETEKENLIVQPPGSPTAKYTVGRVQFVSQQKDGAHVNSVWTETDEDGAIQTYEIIWILRRQDPAGWRIAGMATEVVPGQPPLLLNFEDPKDMLSKWDQANTELSEQNDDGVRQAQNPNGSPTDDQRRR